MISVDYLLMNQLQSMVRRYYVESVLEARANRSENPKYEPSIDLVELWNETRDLLKGLDDIIYEAEDFKEATDES
jgi:hypothetical protein